MTVTIEDALIDAARALDAGRTAAARTCLHAAPVGDHDRGVPLLFITLWRRALEAEALDEETLRTIEAAIGCPDRIWTVYEPLRRLERDIGPESASAIAGVALWDDVQVADQKFFPHIVELMCRGQHRQNVEVMWRGFLRRRHDYVPDTWTLLSVLRLRGMQATEDLRNAVLDEMTGLGRADLCDLAEIQVDFIRQAPVAETCEKALALGERRHREIVATFLTGAAMTAADAEVFERTYDALAPTDLLGETGRRLMRARTATAKEAWDEALEAAEDVWEPAALRLVALALAANAKARLGRYMAVRRDTGLILDATDAPPFLRGRAMLVSAIARNLQAGGAAPEEERDLTFPVVAGRPLAQALWVGPRLRWVEHLSIASYLRNGWRYQLYVYDIPENVPDGCEIVDAEAILPRSKLFREGSSSGVHAGSLGAFSDLFRYALLARRGGMWTDTDVINRKRFEPDGQCFVSTELNDAGIYGPNGALMAAPAGSLFMEAALERASQILDAGKLTFARIGPELIAEMIAERGPGEFRLLPRVFMNPVPWHRAATFLRPWQEVESLPDVAAAHNIHLYTETWRLIGLNIDAPPGPDSFLGRIWAEVLGAEALVGARGS